MLAKRAIFPRRLYWPLACKGMNNGAPATSPRSRAKDVQVTLSRKFLASGVVSTALSLGFACFAAGCSDAGSESVEPSSESAGQVSLQLQLAPGAALTSASYSITGPVAFAKTARSTSAKARKYPASSAVFPPATLTRSRCQRARRTLVSLAVAPRPSTSRPTKPLPFPSR